ncbi:MAG: hypothetical protein ACI9GW_003635, partial [Halieaceae bacterium]
PWLIDIGRAQVSNRKLSRPRRLVDLMRICYKLEWREREIFIDHYNAAMSKPFSPFWRLPMLYYDIKQGTKKTLKRKKQPAKP